MYVVVFIVRSASKKNPPTAINHPPSTYYTPREL